MQNTPLKYVTIMTIVIVINQKQFQSSDKLIHLLDTWKVVKYYPFKDQVYKD